MNKLAIFGIILFCSYSAFSQSEIDKGLSAITESTIKGQLEFLASDWTEGRAAGTKGAYLAADYIAAMFQVYGIEPFGDDVLTIPSRAELKEGALPTISKKYFQEFNLIKYMPGNEQAFAIITNGVGSESAINFGYKTDFYVTTGSIGQSAKAPLVFVGYGVTDVDEGYDDFKKINIKGKVAVVLTGYPGHHDSDSEAYKKFHPEGRYAKYRFEKSKLNRIEELGAIAVIKIRVDGDPTLSWAQNNIYPVHGRYYEADKRLKSFYDYRMILPDDKLSGRIPVFTVTKQVANEVVSGTGFDFEVFEENAKNKLVSGSQNLNGKSVAFKTDVNSEVVKVRNVVGFIEGENSKEYIVVGGHYDHLGKFDGWIWNGADDNASGTVGVMTIAKAFKATGERPKKSVVFAAWTAEESGLWGSKYFVREAGKENLNITLNLNYDMIARNSKDDSLGNKASMVYTETYEGIRQKTRENIDDYNINLDLKYSPSKQPGGGSDHAPFAVAGIPFFYFMAAMHPDYHQPSDEPEKINWEKMRDIIKVGFLNTWEFANSNNYLHKNDVIIEEMGK